MIFHGNLREFGARPQQTGQFETYVQVCLIKSSKCLNRSPEQWFHTKNKRQHIQGHVSIGEPLLKKKIVRWRSAAGGWRWPTAEERKVEAGSERAAVNENVWESGGLGSVSCSGSDPEILKSEFARPFSPSPNLFPFKPHYVFRSGVRLSI